MVRKFPLKSWTCQDPPPLEGKCPSFSCFIYLTRPLRASNVSQETRFHFAGKIKAWVEHQYMWTFGWKRKWDDTKKTGTLQKIFQKKAGENERISRYVFRKKNEILTSIQAFVIVVWYGELEYIIFFFFYYAVFGRTAQRRPQNAVTIEPSVQLSCFFSL